MGKTGKAQGALIAVGLALVAGLFWVDSRNSAYRPIGASDYSLSELSQLEKIPLPVDGKYSSSTERWSKAADAFVEAKVSCNEGVAVVASKALDKEGKEVVERTRLMVSMNAESFPIDCSGNEYSLDRRKMTNLELAKRVMVFEGDVSGK